MIRKHHLPHEFPRAVLAEAERRAQLPRESELSRRAKIFAICPSSPSTAKPRAILTTPSTSSTARMARGICRCTSPMFRTTSAAASRWIRKRACAAPAFIFRTAPSPCCPRAFQRHLLAQAAGRSPGDERAYRTRSVRQYRKLADLTSGVISSAARMTYTDVNTSSKTIPRSARNTPRTWRKFPQDEQLALILNARRTRHGTIDFDLPERVIAFDDQQR